MDIDYLDTALTKDWNQTTRMDFLEDVAVARYVCLFLEKKNILAPFIEQLRLSSQRDSMVTNEQALSLMLKLSNKNNLKEFKAEFDVFLDDQIKISMREGKLRKKYKRGLLSSKSFR
jgi:hypothetical protein